MSQSERVTTLSDKANEKGSYVLYWMQASVRTRCNYALEYAINLANHHGRSLVVLFVLTDSYLGAGERHYWFLAEGLADVEKALSDRGIPFVIAVGDPKDVVLQAASGCSTLVIDGGYLRIQRDWRQSVASACPGAVVEVESNVVVPVQTASTKEEYSAATIRKKIQTRQEQFLEPPTELTYRQASRDVPAEISRLDRRILPSDLRDRAGLRRVLPGLAPMEPGRLSGGQDAAKEVLQTFLSDRLSRYAESRNDPVANCLSDMSPYLHFGHIAPQEIVSAVREATYRTEPHRNEDNLYTLMEELIVRRELAVNFVVHNPNYDSFRSLPDWAKKTLDEHRGEPREYHYSIRELENGETHDPYWNACQREMVETGKMHGYMRMYWGKKILEWNHEPEEAYNHAIYLNDKYELDGRDPNGYAGVAWCFGKHDRPWTERPIFGKVRYMNANGLRRKFKIDQYADRWK